VRRSYRERWRTDRRLGARPAGKTATRRLGYCDACFVKREMKRSEDIG
jgi:hypothetical protein